MADFKVPVLLYKINMLDYAELACSECDPFAPNDRVMYWVPLTGGEVTADVLREPPWDTVEDGDAWLYDQPTGLTMTAEQVAERLLDD